MANAKKCDRCGKYYENKNPGFSVSRLKYAGDLMGRIDIDLCPDCCEQFNKWLEDKNAIVKVLHVDEITTPENKYKVTFEQDEAEFPMYRNREITPCEFDYSKGPHDITDSCIKIKKDEGE